MVRPKRICFFGEQILQLLGRFKEEPNGSFRFRNPFYIAMSARCVDIIVYFTVLSSTWPHFRSPMDFATRAKSSDDKIRPKS
jgi:hypothetical protein